MKKSTRQGCITKGMILIDGKCYKKDDPLEPLIHIAEKLGFKSYPGQSMMSNTEVIHFINKNNELLDIILDRWPEKDTLEAIKGE
jgi:hypothetical protein